MTAMALFVSGDVEQSLRVVRAGADHAADDPVRPNLLYLHVLAFLGSVVLGEDETLEAIGLIEASSAPGIRAGGSWVRANLLAGRDAPAAIALYQAKAVGGSRRPPQKFSPSPTSWANGDFWSRPTSGFATAEATGNSAERRCLSRTDEIRSRTGDGSRGGHTALHHGCARACHESRIVPSLIAEHRRSALMRGV